MAWHFSVPTWPSTSAVAVQFTNAPTKEMVTARAKPYAQCASPGKALWANDFGSANPCARDVSRETKSAPTPVGVKPRLPGKRGSGKRAFRTMDDNQAGIPFGLRRGGA